MSLTDLYRLALAAGDIDLADAIHCHTLGYPGYGAQIAAAVVRYTAAQS